MASILKLRIQGVRAFDNYTAQDLEFATPLTLICGQNGVGKTTVIEALRYATTGDLPPNAKGGAFVHDPRMAAEAEVYAQVKLLYTDSRGHRMVATRSMRLSVSARGTASFKTLEGQLKVYGDSGDSGAVSSRCADLNAQIPLSLGVPPAILNYVVFCHQEDSLWPLAEPSVVKKRFDEIFEATKYSKALESLKTIRKDYMVGIRVDKVNVEHLHADRQRVDEKQLHLSTLETRVANLTSDCQRIQQLRKTKTAELNNAVALSQQIQQLEFALNDATREASRLVQDIDLLRADTEILEAPTAQLETEIAEWDTRASDLDSELSRLQESRSQLDKQVDSIRQTLAGLSNQQGRIEQALEARTATTKKLDALTAGKPPREFRAELNQSRVDLDDKIAGVEVTHRKAEAELSHAISVQEAKVLSLRQTISDRRTAIREAEAKIQALRALIEDHDRERSQTDMEYMGAALEKLETQLSEARTESSSSSNSARLEKAQSGFLENEIAVKKARARLQDAIQSSSVKSRLVFLQDSLKESQARRDAALTQVRETLESEAASGEDAEKEISAAEESKRNAAAKHAQLESELGAATSNAAHAATQIQGLRAEQLDIETALTVRPAEYEEILKDAEEDIVVATENREQAAFTHRFFTQAVAKASESTPVCLLCDHHQSKEEAKSFIARMLERIDALPMTPELARKEAETAQAHLEQLRAQGPRVQRWNQIDQEILTLESDAVANEDRITTLKSSVKSANAKVREATSQYEYLTSALRQPLAALTHSADEVRELKIKIGTEEAILEGVDTATPQQAQDELTEAESRLHTSRSLLESLREEEQDRHQKLQSLEQRISSIKLRISEYDLATTKRRQTEQSLKETEDLAHRIQKDLGDAQEALPGAEDAVMESQTALRDMKHRFATVERELVHERSSAMDIMRQFDALESEILAFEAQHGSDPLSRIESERLKAQTERDRMESASAKVEEDIKHRERMLSDLNNYQRKLRDNLRLRSIVQELDSVREKRETIKEECSAARSQLGDYENHIKELQEAVSTANAEIATKSGEAKAMTEQIVQIRHELATTYKDTAEHHQRALAQLESSEGAAEDLVKYVRALDGAIMKYHSLKMAEINSLLDELWKRTYTGTDIDTILIRSESDAGSSSTRAAYNYRVCMVKQDTELDMRGRCSAGQKVLASILIRMALAECFSNSLGLIVLDEPTTNLDHDNIVALAQSLSDIIASRRAQKNFQLIVITHDEHFLTQMNPADYCSWYYRIQRNSRQLSTIKRLPITSLS